jgi:hypothetical protein
MKTYKVNVAPLEPIKEPTAHLLYAGESFELPYTVMSLLSGWIASGSRGYSFPGISGNVATAFAHVSHCMGYDANPPEPNEHTDMLRRIGHPVDRPVFKIPSPTLTEYAEGHKPAEPLSAPASPEQMYAALKFTFNLLTHLVFDEDRKDRLPAEVLEAYEHIKKAVLPAMNQKYIRQ